MSRLDTQFKLRLPDAEKEFIRGVAQRNCRSMTGEIVAMIRERMAREGDGGANAVGSVPAVSSHTAVEAAGSSTHSVGAP